MLDFVRRSHIPCSIVISAICAPLNEGHLGEGECPIQPWRWLLGRLNVLERFQEGHLYARMPDAGLLLKSIRHWVIKVSSFAHIR